MARAIVPVLVAAALMLTACSKANAPTAPGSDPTPATPVVQTPATPSQGGSDPQDSETRGQDAPSGKAPVGSGTAPVPPVKVEPQIKWYSRGIGLPLTSDDPAAQGKKVVVLTFDDGPSDSGSTASVLDSLKAHNVKAMFFITGYGARNRDLVERIHKEGHVLGPHSMTHANLSRLPLAEVQAEVDPLLKLIEEVAGYKAKYLRPPFGAYNDQLINYAKENGMEVLNWTDGSLDWEGVVDGYKDPKLVVEQVMEQLHPGAVVLLHDTLKHTAEALPEIITKIKAEGYEFIVLN